jgi:hypothetical protein
MGYGLDVQASQNWVWSSWPPGALKQQRSVTAVVFWQLNCGFKHVTGIPARTPGTAIINTRAREKLWERRMNESAPLPPTINDFSGTECPLCTLPSLGIEVIVKQHSAITKSACHTPLAEEDRHPNRKAKIVYPTCSPSSTRGRFKQSYSLGSANQEHLL